MRYRVLRATIAALCLAGPAGATAGAKSPLARYVVLGAGGAVIARVVTDQPACPSVEADGRAIPMAVRAGPETLAQRPTLSKPELSKPSAFPVTVCEARLPAGTRRASAAGARLPLPKARADRILVIGDTGCRVKASDKAYQACNDPAAYPFATIARLAAAWKPDLVVHVGDYVYRETACTVDHPGCRGSPWGYGWDAWNADFFSPAAPLLAVAPLVLARGNHENCARAGQGWFRLLDPSPLTPGHDCNDAAKDFAADDSAPYAVPLGGGVQIVVMDLSIAGNRPLTPDDPRMAQFRQDWRSLRDLAAQAPKQPCVAEATIDYASSRKINAAKRPKSKQTCDGLLSTIMVTHRPVLAFGATSNAGQATLFGGNGAIQSAFLAEDPDLFPKGVDVLLAGHIHLWEQVSFSSPHPTQFVAGFSGTQEDTVPLPAVLPPGATPGAGAVPDAFSSWIEGFGYMTLERGGPGTWRVTVWNIQGQVVNRCRIAGRRSTCEKPKVE